MINKKVVRDIPLDPPPCETYPPQAGIRLDWSEAANACPLWFRDAKFGIFFHWGPYCVPAYQNEWYSRTIYREDHPSHKYHEEKYGSVRQFGYKNFIKDFKGERFDPDEWVRLFSRAGAKYFIASAEHADGFAMWNSRVNPLNSVNYGIGRDVIGELKQAADRGHMRFGVSLHHSWNWGWFASTDPLADVYRPENEIYYGKPVPYSASKDFPTYIMPDQEFQRVWLEKCREVVDEVLPDLLYFDGRLYIIEEKYRLEFARYYLERAKAAGKESLVTYKDRDWDENAGMLDFECRWMPDIREKPWQLDDKSVWRTWSYVEGGKHKSSKELIHQLADIVSKNGNFLLNIGPKKDGTFDGETVSTLEAIGDWLAVNGEAVYGTRPFTIYGEGPTRQITDRGISLPEDLLPFTPEDIRFTQKEGVLYAIILGLPEEREVNIRSLAEGSAHFWKVGRIDLLGGGEKLTFSQDERGLRLELPPEIPCGEAFVLKLFAET